MSDLDNFFAKKDKKKGKKGKKFTTGDEINKRLEDTEKKSEKSIIAAANEQAKQEKLRSRDGSLDSNAAEPAKEVKVNIVTILVTYGK